MCANKERKAKQTTRRLNIIIEKQMNWVHTKSSSMNADFGRHSDPTVFLSFFLCLFFAFSAFCSSQTGPLMAWATLSVWELLLPLVCARTITRSQLLLRHAWLLPSLFLSVCLCPPLSFCLSFFLSLFNSFTLLLRFCPLPSCSLPFSVFLSLSFSLCLSLSFCLSLSLSLSLSSAFLAVWPRSLLATLLMC